MKSKSALERAVAAAFVDELIEVADVGVSPLRTRTVWEACIAWCRDHALPVPSVQQLANAIRESGGIAAKTNGQRVWRGIQWRTECDVLDFTPIANRDALRRMASVEPYMPLDVFCELANIGRSTFYDMQRRGSGPRIVKRNGRILIRALHALDWCRANGRYVAICALADWLEAEIEKPSTRARNAIAKGLPVMKTVHEHAKSRTYAA